MGTDDRARDVLVRLAYGYRVSISFALVVTSISYAVGILFGAVLGFYGGVIDITGQRLVEIWGAIPFLYTVTILSALLGATFWLLVLILAAFGWTSITYYIRGEFSREKAKDYVAAAIAAGERNISIIIRHILPNALTPVITLMPFAMVITIESLVALDFLGYGLPPPTPMGRVAAPSQSQLDGLALGGLSAGRDVRDAAVCRVRRGSGPRSVRSESVQPVEVIGKVGRSYIPSKEGRHTRNEHVSVPTWDETE